MATGGPVANREMLTASTGERRRPRLIEKHRPRLHPTVADGDGARRAKAKASHGPPGHETGRLPPGRAMQLREYPLAGPGAGFRPSLSGPRIEPREERHHPFRDGDFWILAHRPVLISLGQAS